MADKKRTIFQDLNSALFYGFDKNVQQQQKTVHSYTIKNDKPFTIIMIDVDNFKNYNDNYGHGRGDICLFQIATALKKVLDPESDSFVARYGGEEFVIVLPEMGSIEVYDLAQNLCQTIMELGIMHEFSNEASIVTISVGVASIINSNDATGVSYLDLLQRADEALYKAKTTGRNKVVIYQ